MLDLYSSTPDALHNDKLALIYKANEENKVAVKTPVGLTSRTSIPTIVMQGWTFGPMQCPNSIDALVRNASQGKNICILTKNKLK
jgi:hypothetical protein